MAAFLPRPVFQLRRDPAHLDGSNLGSVNCGPSAAATLVEFATCGAKRTSGAAVRELTNDTVGGTTISVLAAALKAGFGVEIDVNTGPFEGVTRALMAGRGVTLSGSSEVTRGTPFQASETFDGNHQWALTDSRRDDRGQLELLVFDPLADGRRRGIATSPMWMPVELVREFAGKLDLRSQAEKQARRPRRPLGEGRATYGVTEAVTCGPVGQPAGDVPLHTGASLVNGQAGRDRVVKVPVARIREEPTTASAIVGRKRAGEAFRSFQVVKGQRVAGSAVWFGDRNGTRWMHASLFRDLTEEVAEPGLDELGEDPAAAAAPDAVEDQGVEDEMLEGTEDGIDEQTTDDPALGGATQP
ncbi:MAG TPA: hypothetical protein VIV06_05960 [Candidatus Limnocylindrales bacterium]